jgi:hypothetical protein
VPVEAIDPSTGESVATYETHDDEVELRLSAPGTASLHWRGTSTDDRSNLLRAAADELEKRRDDLAELMTTEMGKPITAPRPRSTSAPGSAATRPTTARPTSPTTSSPPTRSSATSGSTRSARCWP